MSNVINRLDVERYSNQGILNSLNTGISNGVVFYTGQDGNEEIKVSSPTDAPYALRTIFGEAGEELYVRPYKHCKTSLDAIHTFTMAHNLDWNCDHLIVLEPNNTYVINGRTINFKGTEVQI